MLNDFDVDVMSGR